VTNIVPFAEHEAFRKGLTLLSQAYGFEVRDYRELRSDLWRNHREVDLWGDDTSTGPSTHALSWKRRILWLDTKEDKHAEWLHEVAHLVVLPPWEPKGPNSSDEMAGIFTWENQVAHELYRRKVWSPEDFEVFRSIQASFGATNNGHNWVDTTPSSQKLYLAYTRKTLRMAGLLDARNRPTFQAPRWTDEVKARWALYNDILIGKRRG